MSSPLTPPDPLFLGSSVSPTPELSNVANPADPLVSGLKALLDPAIRQTTDKLGEVYASQQALSVELDRLIARKSALLCPPSVRMALS